MGLFEIHRDTCGGGAVVLWNLQIMPFVKSIPEKLADAIEGQEHDVIDVFLHEVGAHMGQGKIPLLALAAPRPSGPKSGDPGPLPPWPVRPR